MKKLIKHIISLALVLTLSFSLSGCTMMLLKQAHKENDALNEQYSQWVDAQKWSDDYAIVYLDNGVQGSSANKIPYAKYKRQTFTIKSPLEKGGFFEEGYDYTFRYQEFKGSYYVDTMKYKKGCADDDPVTVYLLRVEPPFIGDEYDVVYEYRTTYDNKCIYYSQMDKYFVREYPGIIHFINTETENVSAFDLDTGVHLFSVSYGDKNYLETWFDEENKTVSFKVYDYDLNVYTTSAYDIGWYLDLVVENYKLTSQYNFDVYGDYVIFGRTYPDKPDYARLVNYKPDELEADDQLKQSVLSVAHERKIYSTSDKYKQERTTEIDGNKGYIKVLGRNIILNDLERNEFGTYDTLWEKSFADIPAMNIYFENLPYDKLNYEDVSFNYGKLFFALYASQDDQGFVGLLTFYTIVPTMVFGYDPISDEIEYIGYIPSNRHNDLLGVYKVTDM